MTGFNVVSDELTAHASHLGGFGDRLGTALSAAQTAAMSEGCYGLLCSFVPPVINPMEEQAVELLKSAQAAMDTTADNVRTAGSSYEEQDDTATQPFEDSLAEDGWSA
jgi:uncharacterized protein YukE